MYKSIKSQQKIKGYTLIELMVGLGVGTFIIVGAILLFSAFSKSSHDLISATRLDHEIRTALSLMSEDIRRAGFSASASNDLNSGKNTNNFMAVGADINTPLSNCILFTYDKNSTGALPPLNTSPTDNRFGYRLSNNTIQVRPEYSTQFTCNATDWDDLTDPNFIEITNLTFTITPTVVALSGAGTLTIRDVTISITGRLARDNTVTSTLAETIRVRNDKYSP